MLIVGSVLKGYSIDATDGHFGTVKTFLFDDTTWKIRWLVVDTGHCYQGGRSWCTRRTLGCRTMRKN